MCKFPVLIPNKARASALTKRVYVNKRFHDVESLYIRVPCGKCSECLSVRQLGYVQRCQLLLSDHYMFFLTFTYDNAHLPYIDIGDYRHSYADKTHVQNMIKRVKRNSFLSSVDFKYIYVNEYGGKKHRPHWHMILFIPRNDFPCHYYTDILNLERRVFELFKLEWRVNKGSTRAPIYESLCEYVCTPQGRTYDCHYVNPCAPYCKSEDSVGYYVTKYIFKYDKWFYDKMVALYINYDSSTAKFYTEFLKPKMYMSKHFGDAERYRPIVQKSIQKSLSNPADKCIMYYSNSGDKGPMSRYLRNKFMSLEDFVAYSINKIMPQSLSYDTVFLPFKPPTDQEQLDLLYRQDRINNILENKSYDIHDYLDI